MLLATSIVATPASAITQSGVASYYGKKFAGRTTASGKKFDPEQLTAAHKTLPFGTELKVTHEDKEVTVIVTDRGPYKQGRIIDLSRAAARKLGMLNKGVGKVQIEVQ